MIGIDIYTFAFHYESMLRRDGFYRNVRVLSKGLYHPLVWFPILERRRDIPVAFPSVRTNVSIALPAQNTSYC